MSSKTLSSPYYRQTPHLQSIGTYTRRCDWCEEVITRADFYRLAKQYRIGKGIHATEFKLCTEQCLIDLVLNTNRTTVSLHPEDSETVPDAPPL